MALINSEIKPFQATAFKNGEFIDVFGQDFQGNNEQYFSSTLPISPLCVQRNSVI